MGQYIIPVLLLLLAIKARSVVWSLFLILAILYMATKLKAFNLLALPLLVFGIYRLTKDQENRTDGPATQWNFRRPSERDAEFQERPFSYTIGRHGNEALAIRYGLANMEKRKPAESIDIRKLKKVGESKYLVELPKFGSRKAIAVIEEGTDYVKTFYPLTGDEWFERNQKLDDLKDRKTFSLKELARYNVEQAKE